MTDDILSTLNVLADLLEEARISYAMASVYERIEILKDIDVLKNAITIIKSVKYRE